MNATDCNYWVDRYASDYGLSPAEARKLLPSEWGCPDDLDPTNATGGTGTGEPVTQPEVTFTPEPGPVQGLDPMSPGGPGQSRTWSQAILSFLFGDDETATPKPPGGCCPDRKPRCLACWLRSHAGWLVIAALAVAAYTLRKK